MERGGAPLVTVSASQNSFAATTNTGKQISFPLMNMQIFKKCIKTKKSSLWCTDKAGTGGGNKLRAAVLGKISNSCLVLNIKARAHRKIKLGS